MKHIKIFEEFTKVDLQNLIDKDLTYIRKISKVFDYKSGKTYDEIRNYDIEKFNLVVTPYSVTFHSDEKFKEILNDLNNILNEKEKFNINIEFDFSINEKNYNEINIEFITPTALRGLNLYHKFYKLMIRKFKFITSNDNASNFSRNIWYKLFTNSEFYSFTSNKYSGVIHKNITDGELKEILEKIKSIKNLIYDEPLTNKIIEFYGTLKNYTN